MKITLLNKKIWNQYCQRDKVLKVFFGLLLFSAMMLLFPAQTVEAKSYTINSALFDVQLNEDGSATITENWLMTFSGGTFTRFYKDIHTKVSDLEQFSDLTVEEVLVDGQACSLTTDTSGRPEYHYSVEKTSEDIELASYFHFDRDSHLIVFKYSLKDVVKNWDNTAAAFCYRFLGDEFETNVEDIQICINAPKSCKQANWDVRFADDLSVAEIKDTQIVFWGLDRSGMLKVKVWLEPSAFQNLISVNPKNAEKEPLTLMGIILRVIGGIVGLFALLMIVLGVKTSKEHKRMVEEYQADSSKFYELIRHLPEEMPLCEILCSYLAPADRKLFYCLLLDLIRRRVLQPVMPSEEDASSEDMEVNFLLADSSCLTDYEKEFLIALSGSEDAQLITEENLNQFLMSDAKEQSDTMKKITGMIRKAAVKQVDNLAGIKGVKNKEFLLDIEYLYTIIESRDEDHMYPEVYDIIYMMFQDFAGILDPAILSEMILRYGWSIGKGKNKDVHLQNSERMTREEVIRDVEDYARRRGMDSYIMDYDYYDSYSDGSSSVPSHSGGSSSVSSHSGGSSSVSTHSRGSSSVSVHDRGISSVSTHGRGYSPSEVDRISRYFDGVVGRMDENFNSAERSSSSSGSSCSSCSSCSGCGGGGAD